MSEPITEQQKAQWLEDLSAAISEATLSGATGTDATGRAIAIAHAARVHARALAEVREKQREQHISDFVAGARWGAGNYLFSPPSQERLAYEPEMRVRITKEIAAQIVALARPTEEDGQ